MFGDTSVTPTYETGINEPIHPDFMVSSRFIEIALGNCVYGCKIYADPRSNVKVLAHNRVYGCTKDQAAIEKETYDTLVRDCESVEI